ncbi:MAG: hypothetical protein R6W70_06130 [bacterium]
MKKPIFVLLFFICAFPLFAEKENLNKEIEKPEIKNNRPEGWSGLYEIRSSFNLNDSRNVVGSQSGTAVSMGFSFMTKGIYLKNSHKLRLEFSTQQSFLRSSQFERFVKSNDKITMSSTYFYSIGKSWGVFASNRAETTLIKSNHHSTVEKDYVFPNGSVVRKDSVKLAEPFLPLKIIESAGAFYKLYDKKYLSSEILAGPAGKHIFGKGGYTVSEENDSEVILTNIGTHHQMGALVALRAGGEFKAETDIFYKLSTEVFFPFVTNDNDEKKSHELISYDFSGEINLKIFSWMSLGYTFSVLKEPQIIDKWQAQNNIMISIGWRSEYPDDSKGDTQ